MASPGSMGGSSSLTPSLGLNEIREIIQTEFIVEEVRVEFGNPIYIVRLNGSPKEPFIRLVERFKPYFLVPMLKKHNTTTYIQVMNKPPSRRSRPIINVALFGATFLSVFFTGYYTAGTWIRLFGGDLISQSLMFTFALLAIVGLHEFGHKTAAQLSGIKASPPYFIPGPPAPFGFGTFGAVIMQREPPVNRDQLFNLGFSGPIVGFLVTLVVAVIAIQTSQIVDIPYVNRLAGQGMQFLNPPLIWSLLVAATRPIPEGFVPLAPPIGLAAWLGFVITFLNLLPVWQLDGGHVTRAVFGEKGVRIGSVIGIIITIATGFWFFGLLILFFMMNSPRYIGTLDEISGVSNHKKLLAILSYVILGLSAVVMWG